MLETKSPKRRGDSAQPGKISLKIVIAGILGLLLAGGIVWGWAKFTKAPDESLPLTVPDQEGNTNSPSATDMGQIFPMRVFVVNLNNPGGKRYLKTKIELEFVQEVVKEELTQKIPQLRDMILMLLSSKTLDEIQRIEGKIGLRNELIMRINQLLNEGRIRNLYFTEFVVQ